MSKSIIVEEKLEERCPGLFLRPDIGNVRRPEFGGAQAKVVHQQTELAAKELRSWLPSLLSHPVDPGAG